MATRKIRTYVVESPMDVMAEGIYNPMCCVHGGSGANVTVVVDSKGVQTWTYDYTGIAF